MFLKKVLNQPNLVGTVMIALLVCSGFVYAFAFDGFNVETATGGEVEAWLTQAGGGGSGSNYTCSNSSCNKTWGLCIARYSKKNGGKNCPANCSKVQFCKTGCSRSHPKCHDRAGCPPLDKNSQKGCSSYSSQRKTCPSKCKG